MIFIGCKVIFKQNNRLYIWRYLTTKLYSLMVISWSFPLLSCSILGRDPCWYMALSSLLAFKKPKKKKKEEKENI